MPAWKQVRKILSVLLALAMLAGMFPAMTLHARAAEEVITFSSGAVLLDASYSGKNVVIENGVFSVTVSGATNVTIIFDGVTIDRRYSSDTATGGLDGTTVENLYTVSNTLNWEGKAPVCPFQVTGNSTVTAGFRGTCTFYAGTNGCTVSTGSVYTASQTGAGYAGIQVDSGSTLTIEYAENLTVYGAHQLAEPDEKGEVVGTQGTASYSDVLRANVEISDGDEIIYDDPYAYLDAEGKWQAQYTVPSGAVNNQTSGGAGIGGGAAYNTTNSGTSGYTAGTPGTVIINGGTIEAFGGHQAAGIGGGVNGAATTGMIQINDGTVTAHGGRWSAGIGDGDSTPNDWYTDTADIFEGSSKIEINGGTVTSYGGVGSPGIGCSDGLNSVGITSGMGVAINGGAVNAFSGFPDGFSGTYGTVAPAAIGAGSGSDMNSLSIYISSEATLTCAGFGNYSLTEIGTNASANALPNISVDSDGYLLLLRTEEFYSSDTRVLELYLPQKKTIVTGSGAEKECILYVNQETGDIYYLDQETGLIYDADYNEMEKDAVPEHLTLYADENSTKVDEIKLAYYFRSIALTLPHPEQYGGLYALTVPVNGIPDTVTLPEGKHIILTVEAHEQGTQSGAIAYPSPHNMDMDTSADRLIDLDTHEGSVNDFTANGLIGDDFYPGVYAYTVYVESDCQKATLYAALADGDDDAKLYLDGTPIDPAGSGYYRQEITLTKDQTTVRLKKMDNNSSLTAITYEITYIKKGEYNLELSDPSKVYDGNPVSVTAKSVYSGTMCSIEHVAGADTGVTQTALPTGLNQKSSTLYCTYSGNWSKTYYLVDLTMGFEVLTTNQPNVLQYILTVQASQNSSSGSVTINDSDGYRMGWTVTYDESAANGRSVERITADPDGSSRATWISTESQAIAVVRQNNVTLSPTAEGVVTVKYSTNSSYSLFKIDEASLDSGDGTGGSNAKAEAEAEAQAALDAGATSGTFEYSTDTENIWTQHLTVGTVTASGNSYSGYKNSSSTDNSPTVEYTCASSGSGYYQIVSGGDYERIAVSDEMLQQVQYTYYKLDEEWNVVANLGTVPPTDAGIYRVDGYLAEKTFNASGSRAFTIAQRPVTVLQIEHWLVYVSSDEAQSLSAPWAIADPGAITLGNVVSGDDLSLTVDTANEKVYYNSVGVSFASDKISLIDPTLTGADAPNYTLVYTDEKKLEVRVFGQIAFDLDGSIFRKTADGDWRKYYPVDADDPVDGTTADYHSPDTGGIYLSHAEYVKARTVNPGSDEARYAVDIEYGAMQFTYYFGTWDVNDLIYTDTGFWTGMDDTNNRLTLTNYSNEPVYYRMAVFIDFLYADLSGTGSGISGRIVNGEGNEVASATWSTIAAAQPGENNDVGTAAQASRYLILSGVPQMGESANYTTVGRISVTLSPSGDTS